MAASDKNPRGETPPPRGPRWLAAAALQERLEQEISRSERHGLPLSCLLVAVENLDELTSSYDGGLREQALEYLAAALVHELRRFDTIGRPSERELLIVLPGADGPRGEIVARRVLERLRTIKVEAQGKRKALRIAIGLAGWREGLTAQDFLAAARAAARAEEDGANGSEDAHTR